MGTWGYRFDECDAGSDMLTEIEDERDWDSVADRVKDYASSDGYEEAEEAWACLEIVAAALDEPSRHLDADLAAWAAEHSRQAEALRSQALTAVALLLDASEQSELWQETDDAEAWRDEVLDLQKRLQG